MTKNKPGDLADFVRVLQHDIEAGGFTHYTVEVRNGLRVLKFRVPAAEMLKSWQEAAQRGTKGGTVGPRQAGGTTMIVSHAEPVR